MIFYSRFVQTIERFFWYLYSYIWDQYLESPDYKQNGNNIIECLSKFKKNGNEKILDLGCGTGTYSIKLAKMGFQVIGIDFSAKMLKKANEKSQNIPNVSLRFIQMDLNKTNCFQNGEFDQVLCIHTFQIVKDPFQFLKEIKRILKPSGILLIIIKDPTQRKQRRVELKFSIIKIFIKMLKPILGRLKKSQKHTKEGLILLLQKTGFQFVEECPFSGAHAILFKREM